MAALGRVRAGVGREAPSLAGILLATLVFGLLYLGGAMADLGATLEVMGFDADRASLIGALLVGATGAAIVGLVGGRFRVGLLVAVSAVLAGFSPTFRAETISAWRSRPPVGVFDSLGWGLTIVSLVVAGTLVGWAAVVLAADVRMALRAVVGAARSIAPGTDRRLRGARNTVVAALVVALLAISLPVVGDMLSYSPDFGMRRLDPAVGGPSESPVPSEGNPGSITATSSSEPSMSPGPSGQIGSSLFLPPGLVAGPVDGSFVTPWALAANAPVGGPPPTGSSRSITFSLPAPWTGGTSDHATLDVYLPAGYDSSTARYPAIYELEGQQSQWDRAMRFSSLMDSLIGSGTIPPMIVVFVAQAGGRYQPSECANSYDGRQWFDKYLSETVPAWIDAHLRTIATPAARTALGFSSGGFCAASALTNHPDTFGNAIAFSGYFEAGIRSRSTPNAWVVFNRDPILEARVSPMLVVPRIPAATRSTLFMAMSASPDDAFYGAQVTSFARVLEANGVPMAVLPTTLGHSWTALRSQLPIFLNILVARQTLLGVFKGS